MDGTRAHAARHQPLMIIGIPPYGAIAVLAAPFLL